MQINQLLSMGGYGAYVWTAYGVTLFVFGINIIISIKEKYKVTKIIQQYLVHKHES